MKKHDIWMIIGCVLPLLLIFFLPLFGVGGGGLLFIFIILCFGAHLLMMGRQKNHGNGEEEPGKAVDIMEAINIRRFGIAVGFTSALLYLGCVFVMWSVGKEASILFFNSLMHGIDVTSIIRTDMPWREMAMGLVVIFILGWLTGATIASVYNFGLGKQNR